MSKDFCKYVDVFYGNGEVDHYADDGLASKWFYIKALCGNTIPHAVLPFGKMSVGAYSGGYPTGYGTHYPSCCGGIRKLSDTNRIRGFSHLHQSGTGGIQYYYNYAIVTPFYGEAENMDKYYELESESAVPGYYSAVFNDIECEFTVNKDTAYHNYKFRKSGGRVAVDFSNNGLHKVFGEEFYSCVEDAEMKIFSDSTVLFSGSMSGARLHFCVTVEGKNVKCNLFGDAKNKADKFGAVFDFDGDEVAVKVSYSTVSPEKAKKQIDSSAKSFFETKEDAYRIWNGHLSAIDIDAKDEEFKKLFYSNFYHSLIKPVDMTGEEILGVKGGVVADFATFWDQYKTVYPLIFTLYADMGSRIVYGINNLSSSWGKIPCSFGVSDILPAEEQAKMLGIYALCDAYYANIPGADKGIIEDCIKRELARDDFEIFLKDGVFESYTHILDTTDACLSVARITDDAELKSQLLNLAKNWTNAYDDDGLMSEKSPYYEGDRYTYSFRLQRNMKERIELAGGNERFVKLLDNFFGFNGESIKQMTYLGADEDIAKTDYHRFQGFNNECDMETPYAYIFAGRHDRTCDIVHECVTKSFVNGKGGLPGNNDSGGLSSCFMWNALGIFPVSGAGEFLIGSPHIDKADIRLSNGNLLEIEAKNLSEDNYYVKKVEFNGEPITDYTIRTDVLMRGGRLVFEMESAVR